MQGLILAAGMGKRLKHLTQNNTKCMIRVNGGIGRENNNERIIAYNIGIALHDIYFAGKIYELCKKDCPEIQLEIPKNKFWI